ncbi:sigma-70 family RNA polymerase sigma factor [candidate division KSB1 bacterium]|nr:sigma-70 family RNA polymerase sigma factor [candidate division KSB1 bacterium]NIR70858.1 sigma-70 family RNA polymerase sigma factor [candidate division KSB1 bacterium]NIS24644.1 sigma-70 family RNA polymerase sigma factor [candidate division KSB1 bacterium]NIT71546.1 sigma-70 family RNA polymerase sigma factor [candidate division KSB1 bacterium]NIU25244.1 sigma-70 family RNA polymerase sigma factor [candidate division KSB1 bacterium]
MEAISEVSATENSKALRVQFEKLAYPLMDKLFSTALSMTKDKLDAEDLVQETYLKAYRFYHRFKPGTNFRAWIFRILVNNFINQYRSIQKQPTKVNFEIVSNLLISSDLGQATKDDVNPLSENYAELFDDTVSKALDKLPVKYRLLVLLSDVNQLKYKEIAQTLGCPVGTVMSGLSRGRKKLSRLLKRYAVENGFVKQKLD